MERLYQEYCDQVCAALKKATRKEKASLTQELTAHMEDHVEALVELGWDPQEAMDYAVEAMGDPEIVGRQYDEKLSSFWLWVGYVFRGLVIVLTIWLLLFPVWSKWIDVYNNLRARWFFDEDGHDSTVGKKVLKRQDLDLEIPLEKDVFRIYRTELFYEASKNSYAVCVYAVSYAKNPLDPAGFWLGYANVENFYAGGGSSNWAVGTRAWKATVEKGQEFAVLTIDREETDTHIRVEIPLDWEGIP